MKINTKYHGDIVVNQQDIWQFPAGVPGFLDEKQFVLYPLANDNVFSVLQSVLHKDIAFIVTNPFLFFKDYDFILEDQIVSFLEIGNKQDVLTLVILTLGESLESTTANLQAPVILNMKNHTAKQVILHNSPYQTKHALVVHVGQG
ncbi:flagellar assembly protein FliW [Bacillus massiliigorillae]|uniref:flagellar assembly protein FliW n=1 Tax=Bacillus massiliigorillae TaxID=1243664 RepID=UPI0003A51F9A|nr:flagellar assembly protein FliW [Bacillus massiliigorillae]